jgi:hypothetical protein
MHFAITCKEFYLHISRITANISSKDWFHFLQLYVYFNSVCKGRHYSKGEEMVHEGKELSHKFADEVLIRGSD